MYKFLNAGVHTEVLDFPGTITFGKDLPEARRLLASAVLLRRIAKGNLIKGNIRSTTTKKIIKEWATLHTQELYQNWQQMTEGKSFNKIAPLD